jgi:hypothetical protein
VRCSSRKRDVFMAVKWNAGSFGRSSDFSANANVRAILEFPFSAALEKS